jgi:hypothetical protein
MMVNVRKALYEAAQFNRRHASCLRIWLFLCLVGGVIVPDACRGKSINYGVVCGAEAGFVCASKYIGVSDFAEKIEFLSPVYDAINAARVGRSGGSWSVKGGVGKDGKLWRVRKASLFNGMSGIRIDIASVQNHEDVSIHSRSFPCIDDRGRCANGIWSRHLSNVDLAYPNRSQPTPFRHS